MLWFQAQLITVIDNQLVGLIYIWHQLDAVGNFHISSYNALIGDCLFLTNLCLQAYWWVKSTPHSSWYTFEAKKIDYGLTGDLQKSL